MDNNTIDNLTGINDFKDIGDLTGINAFIRNIQEERKIAKTNVEAIKSLRALADERLKKCEELSKENLELRKLMDIPKDVDYVKAHELGIKIYDYCKDNFTFYGDDYYFCEGEATVSISEVLPHAVEILNIVIEAFKDNQEVES